MGAYSPRFSVLKTFSASTHFWKTRGRKSSHWKSSIQYLHTALARPWDTTLRFILSKMARLYKPMHGGYSQSSFDPMAECSAPVIPSRSSSFLSRAFSVFQSSEGEEESSNSSVRQTSEEMNVEGEYPIIEDE